MKTVFLIVMLGLGLVLVGCDSSEPDDPDNRIQTIDFRLEDVNGQIFQLSSDTQGKVVVLNFFATTCPICQAEAGELNALYQKYQARGVEFVGISIRTPSGEALTDFINTYNIPYRVLVDDNVVSTAYSVIGTPDMYFIDKEGWTVDRLQGAKSLSVVEDIIESLL